ncbi:hypothetical protein BDA96_06G082000 [Sorghum bicolor]|uniref:Uncharacterized protein n=2 Tax=Sorghum bicolor TaxID=4558 RepID=A0A921UBS1_SORBI|nr:uncharacterized protein LOC110436373 isoform X2 [Sorghum bicolor]KAG0525733.1 hypothetical protein BDA96_06G082000 [Sorghum bicolor]KXG26273.1 hypothetical protein SORBI_3006G074400 [Sorghum bicolor]|eukprot:XP_021319040.1 uncharacterized protein LOC110436373 isoform X2 [Sorghum bicolor]
MEKCSKGRGRWAPPSTMSLGVSGAAHEASMLGAAAAAARNSRPLHLQGEHGGHGCSNMLYLPRCTPHWIKADPTALQSDPGDPTMSVVDLATRAVERAHRAGGGHGLVRQLSASPSSLLFQLSRQRYQINRGRLHS